MSIFNGSPANVGAVPTLGVQLSAMQAFYSSSCIVAMEAPMVRVRRDVFDPLQIPTDLLDASPDVPDFEGYKERVRESAYEQLSDAGWRVASDYRRGMSGVLAHAGIVPIVHLLPEMGRVRIIDREIASQLHRYALERSAHRRAVGGVCAGIVLFLSGGGVLITGGETSPLRIVSCLGMIASLGYAAWSYVQAEWRSAEVKDDIAIFRPIERRPHRPSFD